MARTLSLIALFLSFSLNAVAQNINFEDGFEDGDFTNNPTWSGNTGQFTVIDDDPNFLLQLEGDGENGDVSYLSTPSTDVEGSWEFFIDLGFNPSNSNRADIFLMSNIADLEGNVNGYAIRAGENLSGDVFRIVRYENGSETATVLSGTTDISSGGAFRVKVSRLAGGDWSMEVAEGYDGILQPEGGTQTDNTFSSATHFGVRATYTSSNAENFTFDFKIDLPPFTISETTAESNEVDVTFNRAYDQATVEAGDFSIDNGLGSPSSITFTDASTVTLNYGSAIPSNKYTLTVNDIDDQNGETIAANTTSTFVIFGDFADGDVIINEFVYDPPASFGVEYIELKNTSGKYLNLQDWIVEDDGNSGTISFSIVVLEPDSFIVISPDTGALFGVFGNRAYVQSSSMPALNNTGDIIKIVTDAGAIADSLNYSSDWGGTDIALERRSAETASIFQENWGDSPNPDGGTPGVSNEVAPDDTPPKLTGLEIDGAQTILLAFNERLEETSASEPTNFNLSGTPVINSATFLSPDSVELSLSDPLQNATEYTMTINSIQDIFGNTLTGRDSTFTFTYYEISPVDSGDVFINEFSYDPPDGSTEYIELYNPTSKSLNLQGWTINDNTGNLRTITASQYVLPPDSFVVIAPDNTLENDFTDIPLITLSSFNALNNGGDDIVLRDDSGTLLDSLRYTSDWGGSEVGLERRSISVSGTFVENWDNAPNGFGTPGSQNDIEPDVTPPSFDRLTVQSATSLQLIFSENLDSDTATDAANYTISPIKNIQLIAINRDTVTLFLDSQLESGQTYEITADNISDIFGNTLDNATRSVEYLEISAPEAGEIVINEILYTRAQGGGPEFVELYNTSDKNFDLSGWLLGDASGSTSIGDGTQLKSGEYLVLTDNINFASNLTNGQQLPNFPSLNDTGDALFIQTGDGTTIDSLQYSDSWGGNQRGVSLERKDPQAASNDASNWRSSDTNTPGEENAGFEVDTEPPTITFSKFVSDGNVEVRFSEFIRLTEDLSFNSGGETLSVVNFDPNNANIITLSPPTGKAKAGEVQITAQNLTDVKGNTTSSDEVPVAQPITSAGIVINEIMYNPLSEADDNQPDQSEYIELRNTEDYAVSLEGIFIHDEPDENGEIRDLVPVSTQAKWIPAQGHVLIYADGAETFEESQIANFFELTSVNTSSTIRIDRTTLSLASTDDAVYLADSTGATVDSVFYDDSWQNPNLIDTRGVALERIDPAGPSNSTENWSSSTESSGGTPAQENSIFQTPQQTPQETGISFEPNPFSPDDDGHEDNLFINYRLDEPDYLMKVTIYDRYGRPVRKLADGNQAGFEGSLIWDGRKDDGSRNRIGIYIIVFEAYNSSTGQDRAFKKTVVLARRLN